MYRNNFKWRCEAVILDWTGAYPDPEAYLTPLLSCTKIENNNCLKGEAVFSGSFWGDNKVQELLEKSEKSEGESRLNTLIKVEQLSSNGLIILKNLKRD